jgi:hypothetical protein
VIVGDEKLTKSLILLSFFYSLLKAELFPYELPAFERMSRLNL